MPAKSKAQQQMFGIAHAIQKGKRPAGSARTPATDVAKNAKPKDVKDFASTKTKNLPKKVKKEDVRKIREYVTKVVREVLAEAKSDEPSISQGQDGDWWVSGPGGYQDGPFATRGKAHGAMVDYKRTGNPSPRSAHSMSEAGLDMPLNKRDHKDPFFKHQLKIARATLKMSDQGAFIMGGMTKDEARAFLKKYGLKESRLMKQTRKSSRRRQ